MSTEAQIALYGLLVTVLGLLVTAGNYFVQRHLNKSRRELQEYKIKGAPTPDFVTKLYDDIKKLNAQLAAEGKTSADLRQDVKDRDGKIDALENEKNRHTKQLDAHVTEADSLRTDLAKVRGDLKAAEDARDTAGQKLKDADETTAKKGKAWQKTVHKTLETEGQIWLRPVKAKKAHQPVDLAVRKTPILSVLNLKGGVGKTTLTAFLGLAFACKGWRVLFVDLDLQGSLSSLFLSYQELAELSQKGKTLRNFLSAAAEPKPRQSRPGAPSGRRLTVKDYVLPLPQLDERADLLPTTDKLAYEELNLTFQWLLKIQKTQGGHHGPGGDQMAAGHDVRLILRKALHRMKGLKDQYDIVLMDCPPVVNLSCVNALAASDYVLIPVTPSLKAVERVPSALKRLKEMKQELNTNLDVLGVVVNRTQQAEMNGTERAIVNRHTKVWHGLWNKPIKVFGSVVPDRAGVRDAEDDFPPKDNDNKLVQRLLQLADEVATEMSPHCGPSLDEWSPAQAAQAAQVAAQAAAQAASDAEVSQ